MLSLFGHSSDAPLFKTDSKTSTDKNSKISHKQIAAGRKLEVLGAA
jgi:hypothetical protein